MSNTMKKFVAVSLATVMAGSLAACNNNRAAAPTPDTSRTQNYRVNEYQSNTVNPRYDGGMRPNATQGPSYNTTRLYATEQAVADRMVHEAAKVPGVSHATAVVNGRDAVIGLDITNTAHGQNRAAVEHKVLAAVKQAEPGYNVHVTADHQIHQRIRTLHTRMQAGHPIRTLTNDVGVIIRDIGHAITAPFR